MLAYTKRLSTETRDPFESICAMVALLNLVRFLLSQSAKILRDSPHVFRTHSIGNIVHQRQRGILTHPAFERDQLTEQILWLLSCQPGEHWTQPFCGLAVACHTCWYVLLPIPVKVKRAATFNVFSRFGSLRHR